MGSGSYGEVYDAVSHGTGQRVAIKVMTGIGPAMDASTVREVSALVTLSHENLVRSLDVVPVVSTDPGSKGSLVGVVMELMTGGDLQHAMHASKRQIPMDTVQKWMFQMLRGIAHMHECNFVHRDLKPSNMLLTSSGRLKVADFGLAHRTEPGTDSLSDNVATLPYRAPELLLGAPHYGSAVDMWSIGCIFYELLTGHVLFDFQEADDFETVRKKMGSAMLRTVGEPSWSDFDWTHAHLVDSRSDNAVPLIQDQTITTMDPLTRDLLVKLLRFDPISRVTAMEALDHPFFRS